MKSSFYTLNIDRITKPHEFNVKSISTRHPKQKNFPLCLPRNLTYHKKKPFIPFETIGTSKNKKLKNHANYGFQIVWIFVGSS